MRVFDRLTNHVGPAVTFHASQSTRTLTYGDLTERADRASIVLKRLGVQSQSYVAVQLRGEAFLVASLGALRLGAVVVPLFGGLGETAVSVRLGQLRSNKVVHLADDADFVRDCEHVVGSVPEACHGGTHMALLFTSGTTGKPKGVALPPKALDAFDSYALHGLHFDDYDSFFSMADTAWAYGFYYNFLAPMSLGKHVNRMDGPFDAALAWKVIRDAAVTNLVGAPAAFGALKSAWHEGAIPRRHTIRKASSAGEVMATSLKEWWQTQLNVTIREHYGMTEMGMVLADSWRPPCSDGLRALPGFELRLDDEGVLQVRTQSPLNFFGGYLSREHELGEWFATGDVMRRSGARYAYVGRNDDLIKASGFRISPAEVEDAVLTLPRVRECCAVGVPSRRGTALGVVVCCDGEEPSLAAVRRAVAERVGAHARVALLRRAEAIPRNLSGKMQRRLVATEFFADQAVQQ